MARVFAAVNLPETIKKKLVESQQEVNQCLPLETQGRKGAIKWVEKENLHITLLFVGEIKDELLSQTSQLIEQALKGWQSFSVKLGKICYDISPAQIERGIAPRLIWAKSKPSKDLECLNQVIKDKFLDEKILRYVDKRPFQGHITLGRVRAWQWKKIPADERPCIEREIELDFAVKSIELMESRLRKTGPEYHMLKSVKLL